ncbi:MAG TPA: DUF4350 domain-containing protein [Gemmatimonadota bacterium]|nr:DUF4350 domain-containing protein [Gemmatimonadota bacterium]
MIGRVSNKQRMRRALVAGVVAVIGLNVLAYVLDRSGGARSGPPSSSYTTSPDGLAAYADLLERSGHPTGRVREPLEDAPPPPQTTAILLDPDGVSTEAARQLRTFVESGGRLVAGGLSASGDSWIKELVDRPPTWAAGGAASVEPLVPASETNGVERVDTAERGHWSDAGSTLPLLGSEEGFTATLAAPSGGGRVVFLADSSPLHNGLLDHADNAAFGLLIAGESGRPVVFIESVHGYGEQTGLAAIPARWKWALGGLTLAALVFMVARGRRFGPPDETARDLPPPRSDYVNALAGILVRTGDARGVAAKLQASLRDRVARRTGLTSDASPEALSAAGVRAGLHEHEARALVDPQPGEADLLTLSRALARMTQRGGAKVKDLMGS